MHRDLKRLWAIAGSTGEPNDWNDHFDPVGLILQIPPAREDYWCTPLNCVTFARTGGDGTHYSLLESIGGAAQGGAVVMTVPMSDDPNVIVGDSLQEFLALGCRYGYFGLEGLVHQPEETLAGLERGTDDPEAEDHELNLLSQLRETFDLEPWDSPRTRLAELKLEYTLRLELPPRD